MRYYSQIGAHWKKMTRYLLVDPASGKKKDSDYTAMWVVGLASDGNYYVLDMLRDRLTLTERTERLFLLHRKWHPKEVRYEKYGMMADIEHIKSRQEIENYRFDLKEVGGQTKKEDRIGRLIPAFEQGKFFFPKSYHVTDYQKVVVDLVRIFLEEEFASFPVGLHDDMLDSLSRISEPEMKLVWPKEEKTTIDPPKHYNPNASREAWMA
jgi:predicted phage terminase large subunit-like protein